MEECNSYLELKCGNNIMPSPPPPPPPPLQVRWAVIWSRCFKVINERQSPRAGLFSGLRALHSRRWMEECEPSCLTSPWRPPERRQADRRQGSDEWVTSPRWRLPVCSGLFGQSGGKIQNRAMRSECAHKAEHTAAQNHVKESARLRLTLGVLQHREGAKKPVPPEKCSLWA